MDREAIVVIRDESLCEQAAKAYDRAVHSGEILAEHTRLQSVIVVKLETVFLVEEARPRGQVWEVKFFDLDWKDRGFNYGAGS